ncbi:TonB family protein, partial [Methylorubrum extorquens DSM 13060]
PAALGERAARAVQAAAPFPPPPAGLLTLEGFTELSFPLTLR